MPCVDFASKSGAGSLMRGSDPAAVAVAGVLITILLFQSFDFDESEVKTLFECCLVYHKNCTLTHVKIRLTRYGAKCTRTRALRHRNPRQRWADICLQREKVGISACFSRAKERVGSGTLIAKVINDGGSPMRE